MPRESFLRKGEKGFEDRMSGGAVERRPRHFRSNGHAMPTHFRAFASAHW